MSVVNNTRCRLVVGGLIALALSACGGAGGADPYHADLVMSTGSELASAKATAYTGNIAILKQTQLDWSTIMKTQLKTSNQKTLFIDVSFECGLITSTTVKSKKGKKDTSVAEAVVFTQVLVDNAVALPGPVIYCQRTQELSATFGGIMNSCTDLDGDGTILADECTWTDEELSLMLSTMNANSFNFVADVGQGVHNIEVQAKIGTRTSYEAGSAEAYGSIGKGTVVITEQRLVKSK